MHGGVGYDVLNRRGGACSAARSERYPALSMLKLNVVADLGVYRLRRYFVHMCGGLLAGHGTLYASRRPQTPVPLGL